MYWYILIHYISFLGEIENKKSVEIFVLFSHLFNALVLKKKNRKRKRKKLIDKHVNIHSQASD